MTAPQPGILNLPPACGRSLLFRLAPEADPGLALRGLAGNFAPDWGVVGIGEPTIRALGHTLPGLRGFTALSGPGCSVPSTQQSLWIMLLGSDRGTLFDRTELVKPMLGPAFVLDDALDTFTYNGGRDLSGYLDGTANPTGQAAADAALVAAGNGLIGSSFVAVQRWVHDLDHFRRQTQAERDATIGRRLSDNEEMKDAPETAHVKRSEQESFDPPTFLLRRSMPWAAAHAQGLEFIAYGHSLDGFERVLRRMVGLDDGVTDALFRFTRPISGGYYWCPPVAAGRLDLSALGL